ncbi:MAG: hypothetical protein KDD42_02075 [Bdellovibrionales bacterium]|nr:hypothetical protein [Bdellovibrionales bacterium]
MIKRSVSYFFWTVCAFSVLAAGLAASRKVINVKSILNGQTVVSNLIHNAFFIWNEDPVLRLAGHHSVAYILIAIFGVGIYCLRRHLLPFEDTAKTLLVGLATAGLMAVIADGDLILLQVALWWPYVLLFLFRSTADRPARRHAVSSDLILLFVFSWQLSFAANSLAGYLFVINCFVLFGCCRDNRRPGTLIALVVPCAAALFLIDPPPWPSYPAHAKLVPDDGLPGIIRPLVGFAPSLPSIDRIALKHSYKFLAVVALLLAIWGNLVAEIRRNKIHKIGTLLALLAFFDTVLPEWLASIAPLAVIERIVPLAGVYPVVGITLVVGFLLLLITRSGAGIIVLAALLIFSQDLMPSARAMNPSKVVFATPSAPLFNRYGVEGIQFRESHQRYKQISISRFSPTLESDMHPQDLHFLMDHNPKTRWANKLGQQTGEEYLIVRLNLPERIAGIALNTGDFWADYPAALNVYASMECSELSEDWELVSYENPWLGPVEFTPDGVPFYGRSNQVLVSFSKQIEAKCLRIEQIGKRHGLDWSVAELSLIRVVGLEGA